MVNGPPNLFNSLVLLRDQYPIRQYANFEEISQALLLYTYEVNIHKLDESARILQWTILQW